MDRKTRNELDALLERSQAHAELCATGRGKNPDVPVTREMLEMQNEKGYLAISASSGMIPRAAELFGIFIRRIYREGFTISTTSKSYYRQPSSAVIVDGEAIPVRVREPIKLKEVPWGSGTRRMYVPTGQLTLEIYGSLSGVPTRASEGRLQNPEKEDAG